MKITKMKNFVFTENHIWKNHNDMFEKVENFTIPGLPAGVRLRSLSEPVHVHIRNDPNGPYNMCIHVCKILILHHHFRQTVANCLVLW